MLDNNQEWKFCAIVLASRVQVKQVDIYSLRIPMKAKWRTREESKDLHYHIPVGA